MAFALIAEGRRHPIGPGGVTIGRNPDNDILLTQPDVSRRHATAWVQDDQLYIRDEGSANGTWVNGRRITAPTPLQPGDQVGIGSVVFTVAGPAVSPSEGVPSRPPDDDADRTSRLLIPLGIIGAVAVLMVGALLLRSRNFGATPPPTNTATPATEQVAATVAPGATTASITSGSEPSPTPTPSPEPTTATRAPTSTPTSTPTPTLTPTPTPCLPDVAFVQDVSVPDGAGFSPGQSFTKVWRMRSTGCARWERGTRLVFVSGDRMAAPDAVEVPDTPIGETVDISVDMVAPDSPGTYQGNWQMQGPDGVRFGERVYVKIAVAQPTPTRDAPQVTPTRDSRPTVSILIKNETGGTLNLTLRGPAFYEFAFPPGNQTVQIVPGTYNYTARGCGGATESGTKTISEGTVDWRWWCG